MKQVQNPRYMLIHRTDVELRQLEESELAAAPGDRQSILVHHSVELVYLTGVCLSLTCMIYCCLKIDI